jgi:hypothetical protein
MTTANPEPEPKRVKIAGPAVLNSNECINFHLLQKTNGAVTIVDGGLFPPEMSHQYVDTCVAFCCSDVNILPDNLNHLQPPLDFQKLIFSLKFLQAL